MEGKRYKQSKSQIENRLYDVEEGFALLESLPKAKFDETVELHVRLGVDGRNADQQVRGVVVLPNGTGKKVKVLVIAKGDKAKEAEEAGADVVGAEEIVHKIQTENWLDFDVCITTPDMMGVVGRIARILGPKDLCQTQRVVQLLWMSKKQLPMSKQVKLNIVWTKETMYM